MISIQQTNVKGSRRKIWVNSELIDPILETFIIQTNVLYSYICLTIHLSAFQWFHLASLYFFPSCVKQLSIYVLGCIIAVIFPYFWAQRLGWPITCTSSKNAVVCSSGSWHVTITQVEPLGKKLRYYCINHVKNIKVTIPWKGIILIFTKCCLSHNIVKATNMIECTQIYQRAKCWHEASISTQQQNSQVNTGHNFQTEQGWKSFSITC